MSYKECWKLPLVVAYLTITACGFDELSDKSAQVNKDTSERILYLGMEEQVSLTRQNAMPFFNAAYELIETSFDVSSALSDQWRPPFLISSPDNNSGINCTSGSFDVIDTRRATTGSGDVVLDYNECVIEGTQIDGRLNYAVEIAPDGYAHSFELTINRLTIKNGEEVITMSGDINDVFMGSLLVRNLIVNSKIQDSTFMASNLNIHNGDVSGKIYHSQFGWIDLESENNLKSIELLGANDSQLTAGYDSFTYSSTEDTAIFDLSFRASDSSEEEGLTTQISVANLYEWPYQENVAAISTTDPVLNGDRLAAIELTATATDENSDFLSYQWTHIASPAQCQYELGETLIDTASFISQCQGIHELGLSIFDGFNTTTVHVSVDVIPLPANISQISEIDLITGESVDVAVTAVNDAEDGPFQYSIGYAPKGIVMDDTGRLTGFPIPFISNGIDTFEISVIADNGRASTSTITVNMTSPESQRSLMANSGSCMASRYWQDIDGNGNPNAICQVDHSYMMVEVDGNDMREIYTELTPPSYTALESLTHSDINDDGINEIILGYEKEIFVIDGQTKQVIKEINLPFEIDFRGYDIHPLQYGYEGLLVEDRDEGTFHLITFSENEETVTKLSARRYGPNDMMIGNLDNDPEPELLDYARTKILDFSGTSRDIEIEVSHIIDMDGDGVDELISLISAGYRSNEFTVEVVDSRTLSTIVEQTLSIPDTYTEIYSPFAFIVNVDDDKEKEIVLTSNSINKLFIFQKVGGNYVLENEEDTPVSFSILHDKSIFQIGTNRIKGYSEPSYAYSIGGGFSLLNTLTASPSTHSADLYGLSNPVVKGEFIETFFKRGNKLGRVKLNSTGGTTELNITDIPAPHSLESVMSADVTGSNQNELIMATSFENGYQVYNFDNNELLLETTFETEMHWSPAFIQADINNNGEKDLLSYGYSDEPISWFDPVTNEEVWSLQLENYYIGSELPIVSDFDQDGIIDIVVGLNSRDTGEELHVLSHDGDSIKSRFIKSLKKNYSLESGYNYGLQDVDNDGKQEIIIASYNCDAHFEDTIIVIDDDLTILSETTTDACITTIPTIDSRSPKKNLIASGPANDLQVSVTYAKSAYTQFLEVDIFTGKTIWNSSPFFGGLKPDSLVFFGEDQYTSRKAALFNYGLYTFR